MTRTRKVRRRFVAEKYAAVIEALLRRAATRSSCRPTITYEDGRQASIRSRVRIEDVEGGAPRVSDDFGFFLLLLSNGVLIGLMYALIALGFVLVYKATDAINFAQGEFVMIAGLVVAAAMSVAGAPLWIAIAARPRRAWSPSASPSSGSCCASSSAGRSSPSSWPPSGSPRSCAASARTFFGAGTKTLPLPIRDEPFILGPLFIPPIQLLGAAVSLVFLAGFGWFFLKSPQGHRHARRRRQPAGGDGHGHQRRALLRRWPGR